MVDRTMIGAWRIVEMELWDRDAIELLGPAFVEFRSDHQGEFQFIAVHGFMDVRLVDDDGLLRAEFSWEGEDEGHPSSGRGWATQRPDGSLTGRIFIHMGDDSDFQPPLWTGSSGESGRHARSYRPHRARTGSRAVAAPNGAYA